MTEATPRRQDRRRSTRSGGWRAIVTLLAIIAAVSFVDEGRPQDKPVSAVRPQVNPVQAPQVRRLPTTRPTSQVSTDCGDKPTAAAPTPSPVGPHPRWVCQEPKVTADAAWRGRKAEFVFAVANEGEADLRIRLKGK